MTTTDPTRANDDSTVPDGYRVPDGIDPVTCAYCGAPFADDELLALHRGLDHTDRITDAEREAFEDAYETEADEIRFFRLQALAVLVLLYFALLISYSVFA